MDRTYHIQEGAAALWSSNYFTEEQANYLLQIFADPVFPLVPDPTVKVFGKDCKCHRRVGFFSDVTKGYPFAGQIAESLPLSTHPLLAHILDELNRILGTQFNGILINHYRGGTDYIGAHRDERKTLYNGMVAAISLGASRKFRVRRHATKELLLDVPTGNGNLLVMDGTFQETFTHEIPVQKKVTGDRVSLTFRYHTH